MMQGVTIERIEMHRDARGKVFEPLGPELLASGALRNTHVATMAPGAVRGCHLHRSATETVVFSGEIRLVLRDRNGNPEEHLFHDEECIRVTIPPGIAHAFVNAGTTDAFIVCFSDRVAGTDPQEKVDLVPA